MNNLLSFFIAFAASVSGLTTPSILNKPPSPWLQEAEKKHGRVAMLAFPALVALNSVTGSDPVTWLNNQPIDTQLTAYSIAGTLECFNLARIENGFNLKEGTVPGKLIPWDVNPSLQVMEDITGRTAMLATVPFFWNSLM